LSKGRQQNGNLGQNNNPRLKVFLLNRSETNNADLDLVVDEKLKRIITALSLQTK